MSGDEEETHGFMDVTHNVACCISPEELARRIREAKIEGAKEALAELSGRLKVRPGEVGLRFANIYNSFLAEVATGDWPKEE